MRDFTIQLTHRPGELERIADVLGRAGVNIKSVAAVTANNLGIVRVLPDNVELARNALREANVRFEESEVTQVMLENRAGELALVAHKLSEAGVNLHALYVTGVVDELIELVIAADDMKKAKKALEN
jgi:hypothetical protein